jgi:uncharacterized protein (TIGR03067 family)
MRRIIAAVAFLALAVPVAVADEKDDAAKKLNGNYQVLSVLVGGKPDDKKKDSVGEFVIKDGTISIKERGEKADTAKFAVDPSKKPAHIDISPGEGGDEKVPGIYELKETDKGTELTIAFPKGNKGSRPKDFKGEGPGEIVVKLFRKKEK